MKSHILTTKLFIPAPRSNLVLRPRLYEKMNEGLRNKLILISAPAGYGKTSLLSGWIQQVERPIAWLSLESGDNELVQFLTYVIASLQTREKGLGDMALTTLDGRESTSPEIALTTLINDVAESGSEMLLVLDDYHHISSKLVNDTISFILDHIPPNLVLVIVTRTDPPLRLAQLRAKGDLCEIRANDLRFTLPETHTFLHQSMGLEIKPNDVDKLAARTEGWIAGLQLAAISLQNHPDPGEFIRTYAGDDRYLMDYLLDEVLFRQPKDIQDFLLITSILSRLSAPLCDAVMDWAPGKSQRILEHLHEANIFIIPLDNRREWYRYHHLFASLLQHSLKTQTKLDLSGLHQRASDWYQQVDLDGPALDHAILANDTQRIVALVEKSLFIAARIGDRLTLIDWVDSQPEVVLKRNPWLSIAMAWALVDSGQMAEMEKFLQLAKAADNLTDPQLSHLAAIRAGRASMLGNIDQMILHAREARKRVHPEDRKVQGLITTLLSKGEFWKGNIPAAEALLKQAIADNLEAGDYNRAILNLGSAAITQMTMGQALKGLGTLQEALDLIKETHQITGRKPIASAYINLVRGDITTEMGHLKKAYGYIQEGLGLARMWGHPEILYIGAEILFRLLLESGDLEGAFQANQEARKFIHYNGVPSRWADHVRVYDAQLHMRKGNLESAGQIFNEIGVSISAPVQYDRELIYRSFARYLILTDRLDEAIQVLDDLVAACAQAGAPVHTMKAHILQTIAHHIKGGMDEAIESLTPALDIAAREGVFVQAFITEAEPMVRLLYQASLRGIYPEFCSHLLGKFSQANQPKKHRYEDQIEALSSRETEVLALIAEGLTNQEIALELHLSVYTVKSHARNIYSKLGVKNRTEAVARSRTLGLLPGE